MARVASDRIDQMQDPELSIGHTIISSERAIDHTNPQGALPLNDPAPFAE